MSEHFQKDEEGQVKDGSAELGETEESMPSSEPVPKIMNWAGSEESSFKTG